MSLNTDPVKKQKHILDKLMKAIDKPIVIPEKCQDREPPRPPEFVRNIMGSSAGAGSAEFHLYRNLRKRDMIRQEIMNSQLIKEKKDKEFNDKMEKFKKEEEAKTIKRRAKRLKRKLKQKGAKKQKKISHNEGESDKNLNNDSTEESGVDENSDISDEDNLKLPAINLITDKLVKQSNNITSPSAINENLEKT